MKDDMLIRTGRTGITNSIADNVIARVPGAKADHVHIGIKTPEAATIPRGEFVVRERRTAEAT